jgi:hypothetical protein
MVIPIINLNLNKNFLSINLDKEKILKNIKKVRLIKILYLAMIQINSIRIIKTILLKDKLMTREENHPIKDNLIYLLEIL